MTLPSLIAAYGDSLTRVDAEREMQKELVAKAEQMAITPRAFKAVALAYYRDCVNELREEAQEKLNVLESLS
jgi:hypothetical protein